MIHLYLVRHAAAAEGKPDEVRPLIGKARKRFRKIARALGRREKLDAILTSPVVRAVQTAEILAGEVRHGAVEVLAELAPGNSAEELLRAVAKRAGKQGSWALVGHDPQLSSAVAALAHLSPAQSSRLEFKSGLVVRIDVADLPAAKNAQPRWWLKPRSGARKKGLPLQEPVKKAPARKKAAPSRKSTKSASSSKAAGEVTVARPAPKASKTKRAAAPKPPAAPKPVAAAKPKPVAAAKPKPVVAAKPAAKPPPKPAPPAPPRAAPPSPPKAEPVLQKFMGSPRPPVPAPAIAPVPPLPPAAPPSAAPKPEDS